MKKRRLLYALSSYAVLATIAALVLSGQVLAAVLVLLFGLALKTLIAYKADWGSDQDGPQGVPENPARFEMKQDSRNGFHTGFRDP